jgi:hypothetical protein
MASVRAGIIENPVNPREREHAPDEDANFWRPGRMLACLVFAPLTAWSIIELVAWLIRMA